MNLPIDLQNIRFRLISLAVAFFASTASAQENLEPLEIDFFFNQGPTNFLKTDKFTVHQTQAGSFVARFDTGSLIASMPCFAFYNRPNEAFFDGIYNGFMILRIEGSVRGCSRRFFLSEDGGRYFTQEYNGHRWQDDLIDRKTKPRNMSVFKKYYSRLSNLNIISASIPAELQNVSFSKSTDDPPKQLVTAPVLKDQSSSSKPSAPSQRIVITSTSPNDEGVSLITIDSANNIKSVFVDGTEEKINGGRSIVLEKFVRVGSNKIDIVVTDVLGASSSQTIIVERAVANLLEKRQRQLDPSKIRQTNQKDAVAIIIGIEKYRRLPQADFASNDASLFYDYARRALGVPRDKIKLLINEKADSSEIISTFNRWLPLNVNRETTDVYVFFSGHGFPAQDGESLHLLPHDTNVDLLERTAITQKELLAAINKTSPRSSVIFVDSCFSGQARSGDSLVANARPVTIKTKGVADLPKRTTWIASSAPDQVSSSSPELGHGIFSYFLMRGLEGDADTNRDGQITVAEMQGYLADSVSRQALSMNRTQQPQVVGEQSRVLVAR